METGVWHGAEPLEGVRDILGKRLKGTISWKFGKGIRKRTLSEQGGIRIKALSLGRLQTVTAARTAE